MSADREAVLARMRAYFERKQPPDVLASLAQQSPKTLLADSLDVVDFILYLEEDLGGEFDINEMGESLLNKNFGDLAEEVARRLPDR
jgi:acyl carrier protein